MYDFDMYDYYSGFSRKRILNNHRLLKQKN